MVISNEKITTSKFSLNKLIVKQMIFSEKLSFGALGIYTQMIQVPECDYLTFEEICECNKADSPTEIKETLDELINHNYLLHPDNNEKLFAVNKMKFFGIKVNGKDLTICQG